MCKQTCTFAENFYVCFSSKIKKNQLKDFLVVCQKKILSLHFQIADEFLGLMWLGKAIIGYVLVYEIVTKLQSNSRTSINAAVFLRIYLFGLRVILSQPHRRTCKSAILFCKNVKKWSVIFVKSR
jgi:hypothetical protein